MNGQGILDVADSVEKSKTFDMSRFWNVFSQTPSCVAGHTVALLDTGYSEGWDTYRKAQALLSISDDQASLLFRSILRSREQAARTLRQLARTGVVDWSA